MTAKEILEEIGVHAAKLSEKLFNKDIVDLLDYGDINIIIEEYKKERGEKARPELTVEYLYKFNHILDD